MATLRPRARRDERGFTLVEVLLAVTIMGVVIGALSMAIIVAMRSTGAATERMSDSQSAQLLTKWFAGDVQQADAGGAGVDKEPTTASGCAGPDEGTNVVRFQTTTSGGTSYVSYRLVPGAEEWRLVRRACAEGQPGEAVVAAHRLQRSEAAAQATVSPTQVTITAYVESGYGYTSTGQRVLDGASTDCTAGLLVYPSAVQLATDPGPLPEPVTVTATLSGFCATGPTLSITPAPAGLAGPVPLSGSGGTWSVDLDALALQWSAGTVTLTLDGHGINATLELQAPPPPQACAAQLDLSEHALTLGSGGTLPKAVTASASGFSGACPPSLVVRYHHAGGQGELSALEAGNGWTATAATAGSTWAPGDVVFELFEPAGTTPLDTDTLTLTAAASPGSGCTATLHLSHSSVTLTSTGALPHDIGVWLEDVSSGCPGSLKLYFDQGPSGSPPDVDLKKKDAWQGTISKNSGTWQPRVVTVYIKHGVHTVASTTLELVAPAQSNCTLVNTTPSAGPDNVAADKSTGKTKQEIRIVMQPTTNDNTPCRGLAARFTTNDGTVLTFLVVTEGQNVTAKIPSGTGPFKAGKVVAVDIIDTWAGDAKVGTSSFKTFAQ